MSPAVRRARPGDEEVVLSLFDRAVAWLVAQGHTGQWGERPWSQQSRRRALVDGYCASGDAWFAEVDGEPVGFLALGDALDHVPAAELPEVYVRALVTSRTPAARGAGRALLDHAGRVAAERGVAQVRVDCYAGNDGRLVAFYESCGFARTGSFTAGDGWHGALLVRAPG